MSWLCAFLGITGKCANSDITSTSLCFLFPSGYIYSSSDPWRLDASVWTTHVDSSLYLGSSALSPRHLVHGHHRHQNPAIYYILNPDAPWDMFSITHCSSFLLFSDTRDFSFLLLSLALNLHFIVYISSYNVNM